MNRNRKINTKGNPAQVYAIFIQIYIEGKMEKCGQARKRRVSNWVPSTYQLTLKDNQSFPNGSPWRSPYSSSSSPDGLFHPFHLTCLKKRVGEICKVSKLHKKTKSWYFAKPDIYSKERERISICWKSNSHYICNSFFCLIWFLRLRSQIFL